jgi:hypothetical protein
VQLLPKTMLLRLLLHRRLPNLDLLPSPPSNQTHCHNQLISQHEKARF